AGVAPEAITLLCPPSSDSRQTWIEDLPEEFEEIRLEIHDPADRRRLSYLATTKQGRRVYLNRTAVDADQLVILSGRRYDPLLGHGGAEGAIFPALGDIETQQATLAQLSMEPADSGRWPARAGGAGVVRLRGAA